MAMVNNPDGEQMRSLFGPQQTDAMVRQVINVCWMSLPRTQRTVADVEREVRRIFERALKDLREDAQSFGFADA
jgi:hypothetical protein